jgi:hypothetical protein
VLTDAVDKLIPQIAESLKIPVEEVDVVLAEFVAAIYASADVTCSDALDGIFVCADCARVSFNDTITPREECPSCRVARQKAREDDEAILVTHLPEIRRLR